MVAPRDTLPTKNEEYGNKEYWCVLTLSVLFCLSRFFQGPEIRTVSLPLKFSLLCSASDQGDEERLRGRLTGLRVMKMLHISFAHSFQTRLRGSSFSVVATRRSRKTCVCSCYNGMIFLLSTFFGTHPDYHSDVRRRVQKYSQRRRALVLRLLLAICV
jgi:hypothetical protein